MKGTLYGIGVGPGDPDLLTVKAVRLIQSCPVLVWPAPLQGDGLARTIAAPHVPPGKVELAIRLSFHPDRADTDAAYDQAAAAIAGHLAAGRDVALLCEGDPLLFGSFLYVLDRLAGQERIQVVPGISSPMAAAAAALQPLTRLDQSLILLPATADEETLRQSLQVAGSAVIMKVGRHLAKVRHVLDSLGLLSQAILVERATQPQQRVMPLAQCDEAPYFSLILVQK
jgi:precorrin-2/cobalt-factor-2 C20-methyltransferase